MQVEEIPVVLEYTDQKINLPGIAGLTPAEMVNHYSNTYPELSTVTVGAGEVIDGKVVYKLTCTLGTKG